MIEAVLFDLYETLISEVNSDRQPGVSSELRLDVPEEIFRSELRLRRDMRMTGVYRDYASVLRDICAVANLPVDEALIERIQAQRIAFHSALFAAVDDRILRLVETVRARGIRTGLITNVSCDEISGFTGSPLHSLFDCVVFSCEEGYAKPSSQIYLIACERLGARPGHCIYVGDGASNELVGAAEVGMLPYQATWFMERWPEEWRMQHERRWHTDYPKLREPEELVALVESYGSHV